MIGVKKGLDLKRDSILTKVFPIIITFAVMLLIFFSGPAEAYSLSLLASDQNLNLGDSVDFVASLKIDNNEFFDIDYLVLKLKSTNPNVETDCKFSPNGTIISGCSGINIVQISSAPYGYGYKPGTLKYNITLNTTGYASGRYKTYLDFVVQNQTFEKSGDIIIIGPKNSGGKTTQNSCYLSVGEPIMDKNIRGREGIISANGTVFDTNNKLSMSIRSKGATRGSGSITSQKNRDRFSYTFKVKSVEDNYNQAFIHLTGSYKIGTKKAVPLDTTLIIDKKTGQASLNSTEISLSGMNLVFNGKGC